MEHQNRAAPNSRLLEESNYEAVDVLTIQFQHIYDGLVASYIEELRAQPDFKGSWGEEGYPDDEVAWQIAFWNRPEEGNSRLQLEFDHPDRESPLTIKLACYRLSV